jgi:hypothetical protein
MLLFEIARRALAHPLEFEGLIGQIVAELEAASYEELSELLDIITEAIQNTRAAPSSKLLAFELLDRCTVVSAFLASVSERSIRDLYKLACHELLLEKSDRSFFEGCGIPRSLVKVLSRRFVNNFAQGLERWSASQETGGRLTRYLQRAIRKGMTLDTRVKETDLDLSRQLIEELKPCEVLVKRCYLAISRALVDFEEVSKLTSTTISYKKHLDRYAKLAELDAVSLHGYYLAVVDLGSAHESLESFVAKERPKLRGNTKVRVKSKEEFDRLIGRRVVVVPFDSAVVKSIVKKHKHSFVRLETTLLPEAKGQPQVDPPSPRMPRELTVLNTPQFSVSLEENIRIQVRSRQKRRINSLLKALLANEGLQSSLELDLSTVKEHVDMKQYEMSTLKKIIYDQDVHRTELRIAQRLLQESAAKFDSLNAEFAECVSLIEERKVLQKLKARLQDTPVQVKFMEGRQPLKYLKDLSAPESLEISAEPSLSNAINEFKSNLHTNYHADFKVSESPPLVINSPNAAAGVDFVLQPEEESKTPEHYRVESDGVSLTGQLASLTLKQFGGRKVLGGEGQLKADDDWR